MFIALEGVDASGKATQSKMLAERLEKMHIPTKLFSFPDYTTPIGALIKSHLMEEWAAIKMLRGDAGEPVPDLSADPLMFQGLMVANRVEHLDELKTGSALGGAVVCDRYLASGLVYGKADGLDPEYIWKLQAGLPQPDIQILLDIDLADSIKRRPERRDRYEKRPGYMEKIIEGYRVLFKERWEAEVFGDRGRVKKKWWCVVDGREGIEQVHESVWALVEAWS